jgi:hypothetical protein
MTNGEKHMPIFDKLHGVFRWYRFGDDALTMWETGQEAIELRDWCETATPEEIDERAAEEFEREGQ